VGVIERYCYSENKERFIDGKQGHCAQREGMKDGLGRKKNSDSRRRIPCSAAAFKLFLHPGRSSSHDGGRRTGAAPNGHGGKRHPCLDLGYEDPGDG
jgi:hypothetical protein